MQWRRRESLRKRSFFDLLQPPGWYDHRRLHTAIGDVPPIEYETAYYRSINTPAPAEARKPDFIELGGLRVDTPLLS